MKNGHGLDQSYFEGKLGLILRDISHYTPDEMARTLVRLANVADSDVLSEPEFAVLVNEKTPITRPGGPRGFR